MTAGPGSGRQSLSPIRRWIRAAVAAAVACVLMAAVLAPVAVASPAKDQYTLHLPGAGEKSGQVGDSGGGSAVPILLLGVAVIGTGGVAYAYMRRRRGSDGTA
jgi:hypothetical protein